MPRLAACSALSSTSIADPSAMTKPSRSLSKGLLALCGSSLNLDKALQALKPATAIGVIGASLPPAMTTSACPLRIISQPCPSASAPLEHDDTVQKLAPMAPVAIETWADAISPSIIGMRKGVTLRGPLSAKISCCWDRVTMPPIPLPTTTPVLKGSNNETSRLACLQASLAAATAN